MKIHALVEILSLVRSAKGENERKTHFKDGFVFTVFTFTRDMINLFKLTVYFCPAPFKLPIASRSINTNS